MPVGNAHCLAVKTAPYFLQKNKKQFRHGLTHKPQLRRTAKGSADSNGI